MNTWLLLLYYYLYYYDSKSCLFPKEINVWSELCGAEAILVDVFVFFCKVFHLTESASKGGRTQQVHSTFQCFRGATEICRTIVIVMVIACTTLLRKVTERKKTFCSSLWGTMLLHKMTKMKDHLPAFLCFILSVSYKYDFRLWDEEAHYHLLINTKIMNKPSTAFLMKCTVSSLLISPETVTWLHSWLRSPVQDEGSTTCAQTSTSCTMLHITPSHQSSTHHQLAYSFF